MVDLGQELEKYAFPVEGVSDQDIVRALHLEQPLKTITLKAPQLLVYHYGLSHPRFVMSFDKGMGKTIAYLAVLYKGAADPSEKFIIVCSENAKPAQRREIRRHLDEWFDQWVFVGGNRGQRQSLWNSDNRVFICTYDVLLADMGLRATGGSRICPAWVTSANMAFDEWHRKLRSYKSGLFKMLKTEFREAKRMIFSSGSAGGKGVQSSWAVLHLCDHVKFSSYWAYVNKWCYIEETYFGKKIFGCKDTVKWRQFVSTNFFHRRKNSEDYPPKTRQALEVTMEPWQKTAHDSLRKELIMELPEGEYFASPNVVAATMKLRQFMVCPKTIDPAFGYGAGLEGILADAEDSELTHWVISTPFREPIQWIEAFFRQHGYHTERLMGGDGCDADEIEKRIARWTKMGGVIIQTIQFAESYELPAARIMYMLGYLHNHEQNLQAEDRIHRDIRVTPHPVDIYYVKHLKAYDEKVLDALSEEADNIYHLMHAPLREFIQDV